MPPPLSNGLCSQVWSIPFLLLSLEKELAHLTKGLIISMRGRKRQYAFGYHLETEFIASLNITSLYSLWPLSGTFIILIGWHSAIYPPCIIIFIIILFVLLLCPLVVCFGTILSSNFQFISLLEG